MIRRLLLLVVLGLSSGCCCWGDKSHQCSNPFKPPINCLGNAYDGGDSPCYRPSGPFWCCLPGPCATCRDPWLQYYEESHANWIGRHVVAVDPGGHAIVEDDDDDIMTSQADGPAPRVIRQAKSDE